MSNKLYAERDIEGLDEDGNFYFKHVMAMTSENLSGKSAIAAELGYRDSKIVELQARLEHATNQRDAALAREAELVAKIDAIKDAWMAAGSWPHTVDEKQGIANAINATPTQCLRDIQAEAGRAGFVAGANWLYASQLETDVIEDDKVDAANRYAERVKAGEV